MIHLQLKKNSGITGIYHSSGTSLVGYAPQYTLFYPHPHLPRRTRQVHRRLISLFYCCDGGKDKLQWRSFKFSINCAIPVDLTMPDAIINILVDVILICIFNV